MLYVFRCLVEDDIPLNEGCLKPIRIVIAEDSMLAPKYPAAVAAGNVETSQAITDALFGALGVAAESQGTMNNILFGNDRHQYYETVCGGAGAGPGYHGTSAVHTHMTNTRLTDPEILEWRYPVVLESFGVNRGSGGAGRWQGGDGTLRRIRFLEEMELTVLSQHRLIAPYGLAAESPADAGATGWSAPAERCTRWAGRTIARWRPATCSCSRRLRGAGMDRRWSPRPNPWSDERRGREAATRRPEVAHRLARFLGHGHQTGIALQHRWALGVIFRRGNAAASFIKYRVVVDTETSTHTFR